MKTQKEDVVEKFDWNKTTLLVNIKENENIFNFLQRRWCNLQSL